MDLLARREHSCRELSAKLLSKGYEPALISEVVVALQAQRLLSDERFTEALIRARRARGFGPVRIQRELQEKGIGDELIEDKLDFSGRAWLEQLDRVRRKKFGNALPRSLAERAKQTRFLQYRGFSLEQIQRILHPRD
ncbi:MAG TPA: regulatory protein RecX [Acidiferrobacterales bacterium]|nr:regulatory protein RecX [Acidiferrobacterales bacterium]